MVADDVFIWIRRWGRGHSRNESFRYKFAEFMSWGSVVEFLTLKQYRKHKFLSFFYVSHCFVGWKAVFYGFFFFLSFFWIIAREQLRAKKGSSNLFYNPWIWPASALCLLIARRRWCQLCCWRCVGVAEASQWKAELWLVRLVVLRVGSPAAVHSIGSGI